MYAKNKEERQVEPINDSTINRIVKSIDDRKSYSKYKKLEQIDYTKLLDKETEYYNEEINNTFLRWNKVYTRNIRVDYDDTNKTNFNIIKYEVLNDLRLIEPDEEKCMCSIVKLLFEKKSKRQKKLFWIVFGEKAYYNIRNHIDPELNVCFGCGRRLSTKTYGGFCYDCVKKQLKERGDRDCCCTDCGKLFITTNSKQQRCEACLDSASRLRKRKWWNTNMGKEALQAD